MDSSTVTAVTTFSLNILGIFITIFACRRLLVALIATIIIMFLDRDTEHQDDKSYDNYVILDKNNFVGCLSGKSHRRFSLDKLMRMTTSRSSGRSF